LVNRESVAVRLAGGGLFKIATAGKPDCYRKSVQTPLLLWLLILALDV
jgi:hypothetical protein